MSVRWTQGALVAGVLASLVCRHAGRRGDVDRYGFARFWSIVLIGVLSAPAIAAGFILLVVPGFIVLTFLPVRSRSW